MDVEVSQLVVCPEGFMPRPAGLWRALQRVWQAAGNRAAERLRFGLPAPPAGTRITSI
jgi:hypothetical protein